MRIPVFNHNYVHPAPQGPLLPEGYLQNSLFWTETDLVSHGQRKKKPVWGMSGVESSLIHTVSYGVTEGSFGQSDFSYQFEIGQRERFSLLRKEPDFYNKATRAGEAFFTKLDKHAVSYERFPERFGGQKGARIPTGFFIVDPQTGKQIWSAKPGDIFFDLEPFARFGVKYSPLGTHLIFSGAFNPSLNFSSEHSFGLHPTINLGASLVQEIEPINLVAYVTRGATFVISPKEIGSFKQKGVIGDLRFGIQYSFPKKFLNGLSLGIEYSAQEPYVTLPGSHLGDRTSLFRLILGYGWGKDGLRRNKIEVGTDEGLGGKKNLLSGGNLPIPDWQMMFGGVDIREIIGNKNPKQALEDLRTLIEDEANRKPNLDIESDDNSMLGKDVGGIDLNPKNLDMQIQNAGRASVFSAPIPSGESLNIEEGLVPEILQIQSNPNLSSILIGGAPASAK